MTPSQSPAPRWLARRIPPADDLSIIDNLSTPVDPGSTIASVAVVNSIKVRGAKLLSERGQLPPVITRAAVVGQGRSSGLFETAHREHARQLAHVIARQGGG